MQAQSKPLKIAAIAAALGLGYLALVTANSGGHETAHAPAAPGGETRVAGADATPQPPAAVQPSPSPAGASGATDPPMASEAPAATPAVGPDPAADSMARETPQATEAPASPGAPAAPTAADTAAPASPSAQPPSAAQSSPAADTAGAPAAPVNPNAPAATAPATPGATAAQPGAQAPGGQPATPSDAASVARSETDWPCVQAKVHTIDEVAVWDGPPVAELKEWFNDTAIAGLVPKLVSRRTAVPEAEKAIEDFAKSLPEAERDQKLTLLFAGVLSSANTQRNSILGGIERFQKRQRQNAQEIEKQGEEIAKLEENAPSDLTIPTPEIDKAREKYDWFTRVFQERQSNIPIACELPTLIEQRVFSVARAIRAQMKS